MKFFDQLCFDNLKCIVAISDVSDPQQSARPTKEQTDKQTSASPSKRQKIDARSEADNSSKTGLEDDQTQQSRQPSLQGSSNNDPSQNIEKADNAVSKPESLRISKRSKRRSSTGTEKTSKEQPKIKVPKILPPDDSNFSKDSSQDFKTGQPNPSQELKVEVVNLVHSQDPETIKFFNEALQKFLPKVVLEDISSLLPKCSKMPPTPPASDSSPPAGMITKHIFSCEKWPTM